MAHWLMKSEPATYSIEDLERDKRTFWDGVRNYQARNFLRDQIRKGDLVLFYHSNADPSAAVGVARVAREGTPDPSAFDRRDRHYDPDSAPERPVWYGVEIEHVETFTRPVGLDEIKRHPTLRSMMVARPGARLSVQPVERVHFEIVRRLGAGRG